MLIRIPHIGDWIEPEMIVGVRVVQLTDTPADTYQVQLPKEPHYQVQLLVSSGGEITVYSVRQFSELEVACAVRDEIAQNVNHWLNAQDADEDDDGDQESYHASVSKH